MNTLAFKSGRVTDFDDLSKATKLVCRVSLDGVPFEESTKDDVHIYRGKQLRKVMLQVPEDGFYCAEFSYSFDCDSLEQRRLDFSSDGKEPLVSVLGGTNGKIEKTRLKVYLKRESVLAFPSDSVHEVAIYRLK